MTPLQAGVPGGPELLIILLILLLLAIPVAVAVLVVGALRKRRGDPERLAELEERVQELEAEQEAGLEGEERSG